MFLSTKIFVLKKTEKFPSSLDIISNFNATIATYVRWIRNGHTINYYLEWRIQYVIINLIGN
jgi:hypothetical protein